MKTKIALQTLVALCVTSSLLSTLSAATPIATTTTAATPTAAKRRISFRTQKPTTAHFNTEQEATKTAATLKQLGCETKSAAHQGHIDVTYECKFWRSLTLNPTEVGQWEKWLSSKGFFVVHNTPTKEHKETVQYRMSNWRTVHFRSSMEQEAYTAMFKMLGCEVTRQSHGDHEDVKVRCATWQTLGVPNHDEAHAWMGVLKKQGFETLHEH